MQGQARAVQTVDACPPCALQLDCLQEGDVAEIEDVRVRAVLEVKPVSSVHLEQKCLDSECFVLIFLMALSSLPRLRRFPLQVGIRERGPAKERARLRTDEFTEGR